MQYAFRGHVVVLINEETASDGEAFAEGARRLGIATIIGTRTWGGEIWLSVGAIIIALHLCARARARVQELQTSLKKPRISVDDLSVCQLGVVTQSMVVLRCRLICSPSKRGASLLVGSLVYTQKTAKNGLSKASTLAMLDLLPVA